MKLLSLLLAFAAAGVAGCSTGAIMREGQAVVRVQGIYRPVPRITYDDSHGGCVAIQDGITHSFELIEDEQGPLAGIERVSLPARPFVLADEEQWVRSISPLDQGAQVWITVHVSPAELSQAKERKELTVSFSQIKVEKRSTTAGKK